MVLRDDPDTRLPVRRGESRPEADRGRGRRGRRGHGLLLRSGQQIRLSALLLAVPCGTVLWSQSLQVTLREVFELQDRLVLRPLALVVVDGERAAKARDRCSPQPRSLRALPAGQRVGRASGDRELLESEGGLGALRPGRRRGPTIRSRMGPSRAVSLSDWQADENQHQNLARAEQIEIVNQPSRTSGAAGGKHFMLVTSCYHRKVKTKTMIYLEREQHRALKARAHAEGISLAELVRRLAEAHLAESQPRPAVTREAYQALVALGASGAKDVADQHDVHLARALRKKHAR